MDQVAKEMKAHPITLVMVIIGMLAIGFGYTTFARASEVKLVESKIDRVLQIQIANTLRSLQAEYCRANGNKGTIADTIEDYERQYKELTGARYPLPKCER